MQSIKSACKSARVRIILLVIVLMVTMSACDRGGTYNDAGCIGSGSNFDSCAALINGLGK